MTTRHVRQFAFEDFVSKKDMMDMTNVWLKESIKALKAGRIIRKGYRPSTIKRRRQAGLQTNHVDLTR